MKAVIAWMLLCCCLLGQERSVVEILSEQGDLPMGRATIVSEDGKAITAYHVVIDNPQLKLGDFKIRDRDGTIRRGAKFVRGLKDNDLALIQLPVWDGMEPVEIGEVEGEVVVFDIEW
jgi:S1-C subfamily serine protease